MSKEDNKNSKSGRSVMSGWWISPRKPRRAHGGRNVLPSPRAASAGERRAQRAADRGHPAAMRRWRAINEISREKPSRPQSKGRKGY